MRRECRERFPRHRGLAIPTCITARAWRTCRGACRDRLLVVSFEVGGWENVPGIPGACATRNFTYLARGPWAMVHRRHTKQQRQVVNCFSMKHGSTSTVTMTAVVGRVFHQRGERHVANWIHNMVSYQRGSIMVCGGISSLGKTDVVVVRNLNARQYIDAVLDPVIIPFMQRISTALILQHDNTRLHTDWHTRMQRSLICGRLLRKNIAVSRCKVRTPSLATCALWKWPRCIESLLGTLIN